MATAILIPLLNPNEPEALLASLFVHEGKQVHKGDVLGVLETTKSTAEMVAEADGFVLGLKHQAGESVSAGEVLGYLVESPDEPLNLTPAGATSKLKHESTKLDDLPGKVRITRPAAELARQHGIDISLLPVGPLITEADIRAVIERSAQPAVESSIPPAFDATALLVYGGGGHGKAVIELLRALDSYQLVGIVDDGLLVGQMILDVPILGGSEVLPALFGQGVHLAVNAVGGIGNVNTRIRVFERLAQAGFTCPAVIHPRAYVEPSAVLAAGVQIFPHAYVGSDARLGFGCIVNTGAIISHDCVLEDFVNISPGAILAGEVQVGQGVLIGMGATVNLQATVGAGARIGNGATVKSSVPERGLVRAGAVWPE
jgi:sugar O-acyltransferase (sialic acid O-acetyltransferase NeuD family)